jgi:alpha-D-xyloside xylohydrolase
MHHADDPICWHIDDEYYFGDDFLVAPVMSDDNKRDIYLPDGEWVNFFSGERFNGGKYYKDVETPLEDMPVFVRNGAAIPIYPEMVDCTDEMDLNKSIILHIDNKFKGIWNR